MTQSLFVESHLKNLYGKDYFKSYENDPAREAWYRVEHEHLEKIRPEGGSILDVGCGLGLFLQQFDDKKWTKYGVDISELAVREARKRGIQVKNYDSGYDYPPDTFDVIVFRGTIQHLDTPFEVIKKCVLLLKRGGLMAFLSTPNANSIYYKLFGTLPFITPKFNFYIPSDTTLPNILTNFGLNVTDIRYPYLKTPYARPLKDHFYFLLRCLGIPVKFAFWGNMMEVYAVKP